MHVQKVKVEGHLVQKLEWKRMMDRDNCLPHVLTRSATSGV